MYSKHRLFAVLLSYIKPKSTSPPGTTPNAHDIGKELDFDRYLAGISLAVDGIADALVAVVSNKSQPIFIALSCLSSFTSGGNPALHSLGGVCLHACGFGADVGALFGAMGVLSAIGHIVSVCYTSNCNRAYMADYALYFHYFYY